MKLLQLTAADGSPIYVVGQWVTRLRKALSGELGKTTIFIGADRFSVEEPLEEVVHRLQITGD